MPSLPDDARTYNRYCALSRALDVVGGRWTLLIVLQLLSGPKRFTDLEEGLGGIAKNLLSDRLTHLSECEVIEKTELDPPARSAVYKLTSKGRELEPIIRSLQRWGFEFLGYPDVDQELRAEWILEALVAFADEERIGDFSATFEFQLDESVFHLRFAEGAVEGREAPYEDSDVTVRGSSRAFVEALLESGADPEVTDRDDLEFEGNAELFDSLRDVYSFLDEM